MEALSKDTSSLERQLSPNNYGEKSAKFIENEAQFRFSNAQDAMATEKLAEGIRGFVKDTIKLEEYLKTL